MTGGLKEARLSRRDAYGTKSCTDEQKPHTEAGVGKGKVARHTEARKLSNDRLRRCGSDRSKVSVLIRRGLVPMKNIYAKISHV